MALNLIFQKCRKKITEQGAEREKGRRREIK
jgi:hypothetical protein